ncbi:MAG: hypothetical protein QNJ49_20620 [Mastigocoleus sp. MO_167.B18]|nr:hypothetical protein [Mastigocoleus sp. MO_167.B18]
MNRKWSFWLICYNQFPDILSDIFCNVMSCSQAGREQFTQYLGAIAKYDNPQLFLFHSLSIDMIS